MLKNVEELKNERFALTCIKALLDSRNMSDYYLDILLDKEKCCDVIGGHYRNAILKEINPSVSKEELLYLRLDGTKSARYLKTILSWKGRTFIVTNYWYGPNTKMEDNRTPFLSWIKSII